jgi:hypothetical protein
MSGPFFLESLLPVFTEQMFCALLPKALLMQELGSPAEFTPQPLGPWNKEGIPQRHATGVCNRLVTGNLATPASNIA